MKVLFAVLAIVLATAVTGCASLADNSASARLAVYYSTAKILKGDTERAARARVIVQKLKEGISADASITVDKAMDLTLLLIDFDKLDAADEALIRLVLLEAKAELKSRIGDGLLSADQEVKLLTVLTWIETATFMVEE